MGNLARAVDGSTLNALKERETGTCTSFRENQKYIDKERERDVFFLNFVIFFTLC